MPAKNTDLAAQSSDISFYRDFFTRAGFVEYEDFVNVYEYIPESDGVPIDSMKFLGEM